MRLSRFAVPDSYRFQAAGCNIGTSGGAQVISLDAGSALKSDCYEDLFDLGRGLRNFFRFSFHQDRQAAGEIG